MLTPPISEGFHSAGLPIIRREMDGEVLLTQVATSQHGVFQRRQWIEAGMTIGKLESWIRRSRVVRLAPSVYGFAGTSDSWPRRVMIAVLSAGLRAAASHRTAAHLHGLLGRPDWIEVVALRTHAKPHGCVLHQSTDLARAHITTVDGIPTTTVARTIVDIGVPHGIGSTGSCLDQARRLEMVTLEEVARLLHQVARRGRNGVGPARRILTERLEWDQITDSQLEDRFLRLLQRAELPRPVLQHVVEDEVGGFVARVDFAYPEANLLIELDGFAHHSDQKAFRWDRVRQNQLVRLGYTVLRFTYWDVLAGSDHVVDTLTGFLPRNWGSEQS